MNRSKAILLSVTVLGIASASAFEGTGLRRCKSDAMKDYACGQCEPKIQSDFDALLSKVDGKQIGSVAEFLSAMSTNMKANYTVVGNSESLQRSTPANPRIMFKSKESELWVTVGTDPARPDFSTVEVMRWDGKAGKFVFQEIDFSRKVPVDRNPERKCAQCHRSPNRPNFDTYVSWAGFLPPRDDTLEKYVTDREGNRILDKSGAPIRDPSSEAYLSFLNRVAEARKKGDRKNRLAFLPLPPFNDHTTSDSAKIALIRQGIDAEADQRTAGVKTVLKGYRIKHNPPDQKDFKNFDGATVNGAGINHVAFDQLMDLNSCAIATRLEKEPLFPKFKYSLTATLQCQLSPETLLPPTANENARVYFRGQGIIGATPPEVLMHVTQDTANRMQSTDDQKANRHKETVMKMGLPEEFAAKDADSVRGVPETHTAQVSSTRYLLEPLGIRVQDWSMTFGDNLAQPTYNFADQFDIFINKQEIFDRVRAEYDAEVKAGQTKSEYCAWLKEKSLKAMTGIAPPIVASDRVRSASETAENAPIRSFVAYCKTQSERESKLGPSETSPILNVLEAELQDRAQLTLAKAGCIECHSDPDLSDNHIIPWLKVFPDSPRTTAFSPKEWDALPTLSEWLRRKWTDAPAGVSSDATMLDKVFWAVEHKFPESSGRNMPPSSHPESQEDRSLILSYVASIAGAAKDAKPDLGACFRYRDQLEKFLGGTDDKRKSGKSSVSAGAK